MGKQNVQDNNTGGRWGLQGGGNDLRSLTHDLDRSNKDTCLWKQLDGGVGVEGREAEGDRISHLQAEQQ